MNLAVRPKVMVSITRSSAVRWQHVRTRRSDTASRDGDRPCSGFPRLHRPGDATQRGCQAPFSQHIGHQNALPPPRCCQCMRLITRKVLLDLTLSAAEDTQDKRNARFPASLHAETTRAPTPGDIAAHSPSSPCSTAPHRASPPPPRPAAGGAPRGLLLAALPVPSRDRSAGFPGLAPRLPPRSPGRRL